MDAQRGSIMPMVGMGMMALFGLAAIGLESGVLFWDKSRLQNATDAAALSAAKALDETANTIDADAAGLATFNLNASSPGNKSLADAVAGGLAPSFQYSATLNPFVPGAPAGPYVRATTAGFTRVGWFSQIFGIASYDVGATAVAGPSPRLASVCDIAPVMVCADTSDPDPSDGWQYGYEIGSEIVLKAGPETDSDYLTPGNYFLIELGAPGGSVVRDAFAGAFERCVGTGDMIETKPGVTSGPTVQGVDTRFFPCSTPIDCDIDDDGDHDVLPDMVTTPGIDYATYKAAYANNTFDYIPPNGESERRILKLPLTDCTGMGGGSTSVPLVSVGCFFLKEPVPPGGQADLVGEFLGDTSCNAKGIPGPDPGAGPGPYKILLYKDPDAITS